MRDIKFRAWDTEFRFFVDPLSYFVEMDGAVWFNNDTDGKDWLVEQTFKLELQQYTGLKDKNGKEIYEGDVVALDGDVVAPITFEDGAFQLIAVRRQGRSPFIQERAKRYEVIGNIYENPELIDGDKE